MEIENENSDQYDEQDESFEREPEEEDVQESEEPEEELDDQDVDDDEEEPKKKPKVGRSSAYNRIQEIQREKYQALDELRKAKEEIDSLRKFSTDLNTRAEGYSNAALIHYDNSANLRLDQAKSKAMRASEDGDIQAMIDANVEIATIAAERQRINEYKEDMESQYSPRYPESPEIREPLNNTFKQQSAIQPDPNIANAWLSNNSWFSSKSRDYNPDLVQAVNKYSEKIENSYYRQGRPDLIMSNEYFDEINNYVKSIAGNSRRALDMKPARGGVAPVKSSMSQSNQPRKQVQLSIDEKDLARRIGVSDAVYLQQKILDIKKQKEKMSGGMYR